MREVAFTFEWYDDLIDTLVTDGYDFVDFHEKVGEESVLLRHDVDWSPRKAVRLAEIEADHGVTATYFFLVSSPFYNPMNEAVRDCIDRIVDLGHNVGLHFSTHQYFETEPAADALSAVVTDELSVLSTVTTAPIEWVSFHNPPKWVLRRSFDGFQNTYERRFFEDIAYRADSNQRWRGENPFDDSLADRLQILTHPVLWGERDAWVTDRLREERDYHSEVIDDFLEKTDRVWRDQAR